MNTRQRALAVVAVALILVALLGMGALVAGWTPLGPPELPVTAYAPHASGPSDYDATLDHGEFNVSGTRYVAEMAGMARNAKGGVFALHVHRLDGSGGRVALLNLTLLDENETVLGGTTQTAVENGTLSAVASALLAPGNHALHANATLDTWRESWIGVWHARPLTLRFDMAVETTG
ncbi:MAG: hypothetical protein QOE90_383 [Thermoplasmata archaeon]|nr:hypothetical protein [Thermoplasmata archaeon]